jgi:hypothetical protein
MTTLEEIVAIIWTLILAIFITFFGKFGRQLLD